MKSRHKLIISSKNIYKEVELPPEISEISIGTSPECDVRLRKELFFSPVILNLYKVGEEWNIDCSDELYLTTGDIRKFYTLKLKHGDELVVKYQRADIEVFDISFMIDFDNAQKDYDLEVDLSTATRVKIGGAHDCDIYCNDEYLGNDFILLNKTQIGWKLIDANTKYGVYVNGIKIENEKEINDYDFFSVVGMGFYYKKGKLYTSSSIGMSFRNLKCNAVEEHSTHFEYPKFNRNSRVQYVVPEKELEIQTAVQKPERPKKNIVLSLIPVLVMLVMTIVLRGIMGGGGMFIIYSAVSMGVGALMSVISFIQDNKTYKKEFQERIDSYNQYIEEKKGLIEESRKDELRIMNLIYESLDNSLYEVDKFGRRLFERTFENEDFLQVYLGKGRIESSNQVKYSKQEFIDTEDPLATIPEEVAESFRYIENAPIISDFKDSCGIGIVGKKDRLAEILKNITLDIAIRHFYNDVKFVYLFDEEYANRFNWVRWLHNVENDKLSLRNIICDEESKNVILEDLYNKLSARESMGNEEIPIDQLERYVIFVTNADVIRSHPISQYFKNSSKYGFTFVFLEEYEENIPQGCGEIVSILGEKGTLINTDNGDLLSEFTYNEVTDENALSAALKLGAIVVDEVSLEGELTKNISMFELLGILSAEDLDLDERWNSSVVQKSLAAPIGVKTKNQIVSLDISDKANAHGPHGLVAGTTGSGKSEILQTYILSMASLYHPYEVGFVIIDFKGGGMANQFKDLPHLIGTITNIDGREINRSLLSIKAELIKRQEIFSEYGVNHINDYIKLYKNNQADKPLPHLIMVVDEFAELKSEHPDFMKELISAARIGRTLGVHLILATQKPAGVVDAQIWSNSKFKLCLKVQTKEDSNEVLKTSLAAEIVEPGRAYFQVGNNEIFDLFQSAYSGADVPTGNDINETIYEIYEKNLWGKRTLVHTNKKEKLTEKAVSQLEAIVSHVQNHCIRTGISRLPGICLPSLNDVIRVSELDYKVANNSDASLLVPIGIFDDPEQQRQEMVTIEPSKENVYIVGSAQSGKTVLLETIAYGLIKKYTPEEVNLYFVDCGSMVLKIFEDSAHVGGIVLSNEEEKCKNLFKLLHSTISDRKKILSSKGVGNYAAYLEAGYRDMPLLVVCIDNIAAFKEYFPDQYDDINSLSREAQGVGISFIVTAGNSNALNYRMQANFGKKFVLNCNDSSEYSTMLGNCKQTPKENAGRGFCVIDKRILEYQTAIIGESDKEAERSQEIIDFIKEENKKCSSRAFKIPMVPEKLDLNEMLTTTPESFRKKGILPIGMNFDTVAFSDMNLSSMGSLALIGDSEHKNKFLQNMLNILSKTIVFHDAEVVIVDDKARPLQDYDRFGFVKQYTSDASEGIPYVLDFCDEIEQKSEAGIIENIRVLIINNGEIFKKISDDKTTSKSLATAIRNAEKAGMFIFISSIENQTVSFNSSEVLKTLKEERKGILFKSLEENKFYELSGRIKKDVSFDESMGYFFDGGTYSKLKLFE